MKHMHSLLASMALAASSAVLAEDQWVYERGPEQFTTTIYFEADNTVGRIDQTQNN